MRCESWYEGEPGITLALSPIGLLDRAGGLRSAINRIHTESSSSLKLVFGVGEIDFIVATNLLAGHDQLWNPPAPETSLVLEPPAEVLAKKLFFHGWALTARDL